MPLQKWSCVCPIFNSIPCISEVLLGSNIGHTMWLYTNYLASESISLFVWKMRNMYIMCVNWLHHIEPCSKHIDMTVPYICIYAYAYIYILICNHIDQVYMTMPVESWGLGKSWWHLWWTKSIHLAVIPLQVMYKSDGWWLIRLHLTCFIVTGGQVTASG